MRLAVDVREWPTVRSPTSGPYPLHCFVRKADHLRSTFCDPQLSRLCRWTAQWSISSLPSFNSSSDWTILLLRAPLLSVFSFVLLSQYLLSRVSPFPYEMVCTAVDGAPRFLSVFVLWESAGLSLFDLYSPLVGLRPFSLLPTFHLYRSLLSLVVLAGLLPQVATFDHSFTEISQQISEITPTICSMSSFTKSTNGRAYSSQVISLQVL